MGERAFLSPDARQALSAVVEGELRFSEPLARRTTLRIGGAADAWLEPRSVLDLQAAVKVATTFGVPVSAVGGGSNLLCRDGGIRGLVIATRSLRRLERLGDTSVIVEAGVATGSLLRCATEWSLGGVEFLGGVPGSVGGGLIMNAGTYLGEFKDVTAEVASVRISDGEIVRREGTGCGFRYRHSDLPPGEIVVEATLSLRPRPRAEIEVDVRALKDRRHAREPKGLANAGSIFKNPEGDYAGRLIEAAGLKGQKVGQAQVSPQHANWIVNLGGARAADVLDLIALVRTSVEAKFGVRLELEVKIIGDE